MRGFWKTTCEKVIEKTSVSAIDKPFINIVSDREIMIENHKGIITYDMSGVVIATKKFYLKIHGTDMIIDYITREDVRLLGRIDMIEYERI